MKTLSLHKQNLKNVPNRELKIYSINKHTVWAVWISYIQFINIQMDKFISETYTEFQALFIHKTVFSFLKLVFVSVCGLWTFTELSDILILKRHPLFSADEESHLVPSDMSNECVAQAWFRLLHTLGNPVDLCRPEVISQTPKFYHFALSSEMVIDPCQHPCLAVLPQIFYKAMKGISNLADVFLGEWNLQFVSFVWKFLILTFSNISFMFFSFRI